MLDETVQSPYGETEYHNYDPDQINGLDDAIEFFGFLSEVNRERGNTEAASVYEDCGNFLAKEVLGDE